MARACVSPAVGCSERRVRRTAPTPRVGPAPRGEPGLASRGRILAARRDGPRSTRRRPRSKRRHARRAACSPRSTTRLETSAVTPPTMRPDRGPKTCEIPPMIGAPIGVDPRNATANSAATRPRNSGAARLCARAPAEERNAIEVAPVGRSTTANTAVDVTSAATSMHTPRPSAAIVTNRVVIRSRCATTSDATTAPALMTMSSPAKVSAPPSKTFLAIKRDRDLEVERHRSDDGGEDQRGAERGVAPDVAEAVEELAALADDPSARRDRSDVHRQQRHDDRDERRRVDDEAPADPDRGDRGCGDRGPDDPGRGEDGAVEADRVRRVVRRGRARSRTIGGRGCRGRARPRSPGRERRPSRARSAPPITSAPMIAAHTRGARRRGEQQPALVDTVREHAGPRAAEHHRQELQRDDGPDREPVRVRHAQDQPRRARSAEPTSRWPRPSARRGTCGSSVSRASGTSGGRPGGAGSSLVLDRELLEDSPRLGRARPGPRRGAHGACARGKRSSACGAGSSHFVPAGGDRRPGGSGGPTSSMTRATSPAASSLPVSAVIVGGWTCSIAGQLTERDRAVALDRRQGRQLGDREPGLGTLAEPAVEPGDREPQPAARAPRRCRRR